MWVQLAVEERRDLGKQLSDLSTAVQLEVQLRSKTKELADLDNLAQDADEDMRTAARAEIEVCHVAILELEARAAEMLTPTEPLDAGDALIEVRAGTGGREAALFASDLFTMYSNVCRLRGWDFEVLSTSSNEDGYRDATASVAGDGAYGWLKFESGVHRVQRVPMTETMGRVHTSTASVAVLPLPEQSTLEVYDRDIRIDTFRSGGSGGQSVNKTDSAVRLTHIPTGIVVACQNERSQQQNKQAAMKILLSRIFAQQQARREQAVVDNRRKLIGENPGARSDRIRTYNFPQDRVTDHRVKVSRSNLAGLMAGEGLEEIFEALREQNLQTHMSDLIAEAQ